MRAALLEPHIHTPAHDPPRLLMPLMTVKESTMTEEQIRMLQAELQELKTQCDNLKANVSRLVDEKADLEAANKRLANAVAEVTIEKSDLQRQLKLKQSMGIQESRPETFAELKAG